MRFYSMEKWTSMLLICILILMIDYLFFGGKHHLYLQGIVCNYKMIHQQQTIKMLNKNNYNHSSIMNN